MTELPPSPRPPLQARSRRSLQKILSAGVRLLEVEGPDALTVQAITREAGVSVGSFYARFQGKDDLLRFLGEEALGDALRRWSEGVAEIGASASAVDRDTSARSEAEKALDLLLPLFLDGPGRTLALLEGIQDPAPSRRRRFEEALAGELAPRLGIETARGALRVRALVGILQDAARASAGGTQGDGEGDFHPGEELLREEGAALLISAAQGASRPTAHAIEPTPSTDEVAPKPEPSAPPTEPDPFDVWG